MPYSEIAGLDHRLPEGSLKVQVPVPLLGHRVFLGDCRRQPFLYTMGSPVVGGDLFPDYHLETISSSQRVFS